MESYQSNRLNRAAKAVIALECIAIVLLVAHAYQRYRARFAVSVVSTQKENLSFPKGPFKYFFEPKPQSGDQRSLPPWLSYAPRYTINADALNDRFDYTPTKPDDVYRIVTLGDSFTYGVFVNTSDNWTELLEDTLNKNFVCPPYKKFEVINLGYLAYDDKYEVERFKRRGEKYHPDLVIWFLMDNDFDVATEWANATIDLYRKKFLQTATAATEADEGRFWVQARKEFLNTFSNEDLVHYHRQTLRSLDNYFKGDLLIYAMKYTWNSPLVDNQTIVEHFAQTRPHTYFYVSNKNLPQEHEAFPDGHPNKEGHAFIAEDILNYLTDNGNIPCEKGGIGRGL